MTFFTGKRKTWAFSTAASLLLHLPLFLLISFAPPPEPVTTPVLKLSARSFPAEQKPGMLPAAQTQPAAPRKQKTETAKASSQPKAPSGAKSENTIKQKEESAAEGSQKEAPGGVPAGITPDGGTKETGDRDLSKRLTAAPAVPVDAYSLQIIKKIIPDYPAFSRKRNEQGTVKIIVIIKDSAVTKAEIDESSGYKRLDNSALRAAKQWRFNHEGETKAIIPFIFNLNN